MSVRGLKVRRKTGAPPAEPPPPKKPRKETELKSYAVTYFEEILEKAGMKLAEPGSNHQIDSEPLKFCKQLKMTFENNDSFPRNVSEFVKGFEERCEDDEELESFFVRHVIIVQEESEESRSVRYGVFRLLLGVSCLQEELVGFAMRRATQFAIDGKADKVQMILKPFMLLENLSAEAELVRGLISLMEVGPHPVRLEVIVSLPDIVTESEHQNMAPALCRFMTEDYQLTPAILDCLSYFCLPSQLKTEVRDKMLTALRTTAPLQLFPNLVTFFLVGCANECDSEVISALREGLDWSTIGSVSDTDVKTSQLTTVMSLKAAFRKSKNLSASWMKAIQGIKEANGHKPLDIIILLILYSLRNGKEKTVEALFRKRIKQGLFSNNLLNQTIERFEPIIREYLSEVTQLTSSLLNAKYDASIKSFTIHWLVVMFTKLESSRLTIVNELLDHELIEETEHLANSIAVLSKISDENIELLKPFSLQMMSLVGKIHALGSAEISQAMNLLCGLAFSVENSMLQDDVHMLVRKQLSSSDLAIKSRGVTGAVMAIKHMVCLKSHGLSEKDVDYTEINNLPEGAIKEAATMVELVQKSISKCPEMICYFNDEFANMLSRCENVDETFLIWLTEKINYIFQSKFTSSSNSSTSTVNGIKLAYKFCMNDTEEVEDPLVLNIANLVLSDNQESIDLRILPSLFHLLQVICKITNKGDLFSIGAVLGCGIVMPDISDENSLAEFNTDYIEKVLSCFVHCINWFRELLSAFSMQKDQQIKEKLTGRLNNLLMLERRFANYLCNDGIDFKPPISTFNDVNDMKRNPILNRDFKVKKTPKPRKGKKKSTQADAETSLPNETLKSPDTSSTSIRAGRSNSKQKMSKFSYFRNLDFSIISMFDEDFVIEEIDNESSDDLNEKFNLDSLQFLLEEIHAILIDVFPARNKTVHHFSKPVKQLSGHIKSSEAINACILALPKFLQYLEKLKEFTNKKLDDNDGVRDAHGLFSDQNNKVQACMTSIFHVLTSILSWYELNLPENKQLLLKCYNILASKCSLDSKLKHPLKILIKKSAEYFAEYQQCCLLMPTAAALVKLLKSLTLPTNDDNANKILIDTSLLILSLEWRDCFGNPEKGLHFNQNLETVLAGYFAKPQMGVIKTVSVEICEQCADLAGKNDALNDFPCINKANFPLLFRALYNGLYESARIQIDSGLTDRQHLDLWMDVVTIMKTFKDIIKIQDNRSNLTTFLKRSIPLLKLFLSDGMPMMNMKFKSDPDYIIEIFKTLQLSTRFLHALYCHSRLKKDTALIAYLPQLKLILETLVYKVKASLTINNCSEAFWMGNLKNKNLQGEIILSQSTVASDKEDDDEDQLPEDDQSLSDSDCESVKSVSNCC